MRGSIRWMAGVVVGLGLLLVGWGPMVFASLTSTTLPAPVVTDWSSMATWAAMGLVRVVGAALVLIGVAAWVFVGPTSAGRARRLWFIAGAFAFAITVLQALSVWTTPFGVLLAVPFAIVMLLGWRGGMRVHARDGAV